MNGESNDKAKTAVMQFPALLVEIVNDAVNDGLRPEFIIGTMEVVKQELTLKILAHARSEADQAAPKIVLPEDLRS
jgi:hypothetical protein